MNPLISVVLPIYNCEPFVLASVGSILDQTFSDFELLIIDDASTDATVSKIKSLADPRIRLIEKPENSGYTNSLNLGISLAKGKYIARMDGDDISHKYRFARQIEFLEAHPEVILCGTAFRILGTEEVISVPQSHEQIKSALLRASCFAHPSVMLRRSALERLSPVYDKAFEPAEDYDLWTRLVFLGKLHNLGQVLLDYRVHDAQVSKTRALKQRAAALHARLQMLRYLGADLSEAEFSGLGRIIEPIEVAFSDLASFTRTKKKLSAANSVGFFEPSDFSAYLAYLEWTAVKRYFVSRNEFRPYIYGQYRSVKKALSRRLSVKDEFKLFVKAYILRYVKS